MAEQNYKSDLTRGLWEAVQNDSHIDIKKTLYGLSRRIDALEAERKPAPQPDGLPPVGTTITYRQLKSLPLGTRLDYNLHGTVYQCTRRDNPDGLKPPNLPVQLQDHNGYWWVGNRGVLTIATLPTPASAFEGAGMVLDRDGIPIVDAETMERVERETRERMMSPAPTSPYTREEVAKAQCRAWSERILDFSEHLNAVRIRDLPRLFPSASRTDMVVKEAADLPDGRNVLATALERIWKDGVDHGRASIEREQHAKKIARVREAMKEATSMHGATDREWAMYLTERMGKFIAEAEVAEARKVGG